MINLGNVPAGSTLYIPFNTFNAAGASVTITGLATTDIEIYKNGSTTQRSSDAGYALLDTDGIDFDGITGIHGFSIDLSDNTDAGFYSAGATYWLVVSSVTVDSQTVNFVCYFTIDKAAGANVLQFGSSNGTFASGIPAVNATQISGDSTAADNLETAFDDTAGAVPWSLISHQGTLQSVTDNDTVVIAASASSEDDVYIGHTIHFVSATTGAKQSALISDYVGSSKTVTLAAVVPVALTGAVVYKIVATAPSSGGSGLDAAGVRAAIGMSSANLDTQLSTIDTVVDAILVDTGTTLDGRIPAALVSGRMDCSVGAMAANVVTATAIASDAITAAKIANGAIDAATFAADVDAEILSYIVDDATRIDASALNTATVTTIPAILVDTGTTLDTAISTIDTVVDAVKVQTDKFTNLPVLTAGGTGGQGYGAP